METGELSCFIKMLKRPWILQAAKHLSIGEGSGPHDCSFLSDLRPSRPSELGLLSTGVTHILRPSRLEKGALWGCGGGT